MNLLTMMIFSFGVLVGWLIRNTLEKLKNKIFKTGGRSND